MLGKILKFNWASFLSMVALVIIGVIFIKSSGEARTITALHDAWRVHAATALFGFIVYFTLAFIDYRKILDLFATPYFWISLIMLVAVLAFGSKVYGGKRWLWFFQPSEIAKPAVILMLAKMLGRADRPTNGFLDLMKGVGIRCSVASSRATMWLSSSVIMMRSPRPTAIPILAPPLMPIWNALSTNRVNAVPPPS